MLALLGLVTILVLLVTIMTNKLSPLVALILVPLAAAMIGGFGLESAGFMVAGIKKIAPVASMFVFAIVFFGILSDAGMMDPIIDRVLKTVGMKPARITLGTAILALIVHLDGSGAVTFLVTIPAMLPLYDRLKMRRVVLAAIAAMAAGTANMLPWGGPDPACCRKPQCACNRCLQPDDRCLGRWLGHGSVYGLFSWPARRKSASGLLARTLTWITPKCMCAN